MNCRQSRRRSLTRRRLASAKDRVAEALALLRQWLKEAEANDEGGASE
jgi:pyridoxine/pyridoxamine 5'-phosphate oxidase